ncbi:MAG: GspMb/PilO family protein [Vicinamibacterales bacterium]
MRLWSRVYQERRPVIVALLVVLVANLGVLLLVVWPLASSLASTQAEALQEMANLGLARRLEAQAAQAAARRREVEGELQHFYGQRLPRDSQTATRTATLWLQRAAREAGLEFRNSRFDTKDVRESHLLRADSTVTLIGRYGDIRRFLTEVEAAKEFVIVDRVELAQSDSTQPGTSDRIEIALNVSTYFPDTPTR